MKINYNYLAVIPKNRKLDTVKLYVHNFKTAIQDVKKIQANNTDKVYLERITDSYPPKSNFYINEIWVSDENFINLLLTGKLS